ncbi:hypothetical protein [Hydrocarboniphaga sp.]|uniref:hypothetical protein n=1 Tax=Hydrocarboniphaga sp. TaxID=2033016 RepID=UPI002612D0E7|nr:hypothetical protein [Hydrocarboniphaga sp.]
MSSHRGQRIRGTFFLTRVEASPPGAEHTRVLLEDGTGSRWASCRTTALRFRPALPQPIDALIDLQLQGSGILVVQIYPVEIDLLPSASWVLPIEHCPAPAVDALVRLHNLEESLPEPLSGFLKRVLLDPSIGLPMLRCRASVAHHHSFVGGLLVHSTDQLDVALAASRQALPNEPLSWQLAQLGYFLHDVGKLKSVGEAARPVHALVSHHETHNLLVLAPHLQWLESVDRDLAAALTYILEFVATPARARGQAKYLVAEMVVALDQWSSATHNGRGLGSLLKKNIRPFGEIIAAEAANEEYAFTERHGER